MRKIFQLLLGIILMTIAQASWAVVDMRYSPADSLLGLWETARISIMIDEPIDLRTIEVFVDFDPAVLSTQGGGSGLLFSDSGHLLFQGFEETEPGQWHGYCIVMGAEDWITGPGELFFFEVETVALGTSPITTVSVLLAAPDGELVPDVTLPSTTLGVVDPASGTDDVPALRGQLEIYPNPFNPRVEIRFEVTNDTRGRLEVFDSHGRKVALLHEGPLAAGSSTFQWNGQGRNGLPQPAGIYFFRMETPQEVVLRKGMLVK